MAHVLLVEDDTPIRRLLAEFLAAAGHCVTSARNGAEALEQMRQDRPDIVVLDLQMPVLPGWSLLRTCRATTELADLPVVVMSALADARSTVAGLGVRHCLSKPFDLDRLAAALEDLGPDAHGSAPRRCSHCGAAGAVGEVRAGMCPGAARRPLAAVPALLAVPGGRVPGPSAGGGSRATARQSRPDPCGGGARLDRHGTRAGGPRLGVFGGLSGSSSAFLPAGPEPPAHRGDRR